MPFSSTASSSVPWVRPLGEGAILLRFGTQISDDVNGKVLEYMNSLEKTMHGVDGVKEILPAFASLLVHFDPLKISANEVEEWCLGVTVQDHATRAREPRTVSIPVCYGGKHGADIEDAARMSGRSVDEVVKLHSEASYQVYFLGFTGGFPYLGGLPEELAGVPRLATPRQRVEKGAVGIAAGQTGVYTLASPGGWHLLGRTPQPLFDPTMDPPALLKPGDAVKFVPLPDDYVFDETEGEGIAIAPEPPAAPAHPWIEVLAPGPMTSVQDTGREGYARHGVSRSGAADDLALRTGNALVGNPEDAAGLEVAMGKLKVKALGASLVTLTGADCAGKLARGMFHGAPPELVRTNEVIALQSGDELELGVARDGARAYLCVQGGVDVPVLLGSRSTDIKANMGGFQGRVLGPGDRLGHCKRGGGATDTPAPAMRATHDPLRGNEDGSSGGEWVLRILPGPGDPGTDAAGTSVPRDAFYGLVNAGAFNVTPRSDRMAVCVSHGGGGDDGGADLPAGGQQMSEACVSGTVQLPPDGNPVILLSEHQTTGGYKVPGVVIQADLWKVGQMRPGDTMRFVETTTDEATAALRESRGDAQRTAKAGDAAPGTQGTGDTGVAAAGLYIMGSDNEEYWDAVLDYTVGNMGLLPASGQIPVLRPRTGAGTRQIDLNADCGEGFDDEGLMEYVTSANIACGGHAGTTESIAGTVRLAADRGVGIGAHVSFVDREGFGRRALDTPPHELRDQVLWQASALEGLCKGAGTRVTYIKPHGALYHAVMAGTEQGEAVHEAAQLLGLPLLLMPNSPWATFGEGFAERRYDGDQLRSREKEGAVIHDPQEAAEQALLLAAEPKLHTICVHGDSPNAVNVAKTVRRALEKNGYDLQPFL